jgi:hypothetical protein
LKERANKRTGEWKARSHVLLHRAGDQNDPREQDEIRLIGAAAFAAVAFATPALAQAVIEEPGYCAQFYPNANCQNLGPGNPYTDGGYYRDNWPNGYAMMEHHPRHRTHRHHHR